MSPADTAEAPVTPVSPVARIGVDPLWVLWHASGEPVPDVPGDRAGTCARCGAFDERCSRVKAVVSDKFTGWDAYTRHGDPLWCIACAWGHTDSTLRTRPWRIGGGNTHQPDRAALAAELARPVPETVALVVPASRHKHLLPGARWGMVTTDDRHLRWQHEEAMLFTHVQWLRGLGFTETALAQPTPVFEHLARLDAPTMRLVMSRWEALAVWRRDNAYLTVACLGSRPERQGT